MTFNETLNLTFKSLTGFGGSFVAVVLPWQENLEWGIRVLGGTAGLIVAILSIVSLWKGLTKK